MAKGQFKARVGAAKTKIVRVGAKAAEKAKAAAAAARTRYNAAKAKLSGKGAAIEHGIASLGGAALTGILRAKDVEFMGFDGDIIASGLAIGAGTLAPLPARIGGDLIVFGAGAMGPRVADTVEGMFDGDGE